MNRKQEKQICDFCRTNISSDVQIQVICDSFAGHVLKYRINDIFVSFKDKRISLSICDDHTYRDNKIHINYVYIGETIAWTAQFNSRKINIDNLFDFIRNINETDLSKIKLNGENVMPVSGSNNVESLIR